MIDLHEAFADATRWPAFLESLGRAAGARRAVLMSLNDLAVTGIFSSWEFPQKAAQQWQTHFRRDDPWLNALTLPTPGEAVVFQGERLVADGQLRQTPFYTEFLAPNDLRWVRGIWVQPDAPLSSPYAILLWRGVDQPAFDPAIDAALAIVARALSSFEKMSVANALSRASGLDGFDACTFLLNGQGLLLMSNASGANLVTEGIVQANGGHLDLATPGTAQWVQSMIGQGERDPSLFAMSLRQRVRLAGLGNVSLDLYPLRPIGAAPALLGVRYALMIRPETARVSNSVRQSAQKMYRWTNSEFDTVNRLAAGDALPEIARQRQCTVETVRSHLKNAKRKAGVNRQVDLVRIMVSLER